MIFAAGLGTRLSPITDHKPKALVEVHGKPLLWYALQNVIKAGATRIVVNVHHFPEQIEHYLGNLNFENITICISDERDELLDTGGGLLKAAPFFDPGKPILIHNADVLTNCDLRLLVKFHQQNESLASLMVQNRKTNRYLLFDEDNKLCGWQNTSTGETKSAAVPQGELTQLAFNGVQILDYGILGLLGETRKFSITDGYLALAATHKISGYSQWQGQWFDVGTVQKLADAESHFKEIIN